MRVLSHLIFSILFSNPILAGPGYVATTVGQDPRPTLIRKEPDGTITVAGYTWVKPPKSDAQHAECFLVRFGADGRRLSTLTDPTSLFRVATTPDGKTLALGHVKTAHQDFSFKLRRFTADGKPDFSFGSDGVVLTNPGPLE